MASRKSPRKRQKVGSNVRKPSSELSLAGDINRSNASNGNDTVQLVPVAISETQGTKDKINTISNVIECSRADYDGTSGVSKEHHGVFSRLNSIDENRSDKKDDVWICVCGRSTSTTKKRCGGCFKWRGGRKRENTREDNITVGNPKRTRAVRSREALNKTSLPEFPPLPETTSKSKYAKSVLPNSSYAVDLDVMKVKTPKECAQRWNALLMVRDERKSFHIAPNTTVGSIDPFDCSDLIIPSNSEIIEKEANKAIKKWDDLDSRIVLEEDGYGILLDEVSASADNPPILNGTMFGDGRRQRLLPPNFDYKCLFTPTDDAEVHSADNLDDKGRQEQQYYRPRVISLLDPTQTLDYETELWHIFKSMPTVTEVERKHGILEVHKSCHGLQHTLQVKQELKLLLDKHTRMDAHSLGRLRVKDRHFFPTNLNRLQSTSKQYEKSMCLEQTVRFEALRYSDNLRRGSRRDCNRLEVELSGSHHTLLDLHQILVESAYAADSQIHICIRDSVPAGIFFIENRFYTHGISGERAGQVILEWLRGCDSRKLPEKTNNDEVSKARQQHLCIQIFQSNQISSMSDTYLEDIPLRLGIRYVHMIIDHTFKQSHKISLRSESALFATDIQSRKNIPSSEQKSNATNLMYRSSIIHDKWTPIKSTTICAACISVVASVVTMNDELTSSLCSCTPLCPACFRALHYRSNKSSEDELRQGYAHQSFKVLPINTFNQLVLNNELEKIPNDAIFNRY